MNEAIFYSTVAFLALCAAGALFVKWRLLKAEITPLRKELEILRAEQAGLFETEKKLSVLETEIRLLSEQHAEKVRAMKEQMQEQMPAQFEQLANRILEHNSNKLTKTSAENLGNLLNPLKEKLSEFQKKVDDSFGKEAQERFALKKEIENIVNTSERMRVETENLTNALKGNNKIQGNWGEQILAKLLKDSGLREGFEFITQGRDLGLKSADGKHLQPDIIINLPDKKHLIIDAKVSLTHYEQVVNAANDELKNKALERFLISVRTHVKALSDKDYAHAEGLGAPDFVLMFIPIEGAHALGIQSDNELFSYAWDQKIAIVSPSTLMPILKTVASLWKLDSQNKNTLEIARQGGALYDKFVGFIDNMEDIGSRIRQTENAYENAMKQLTHGAGNLVKRAEDMKKLGAKASKSLPENLLAEAAEAPLLEKAES